MSKEASQESQYRGNLSRFTSDLPGVFSLHLTVLDNIKVLINTQGVSGVSRDIIDSKYYDLMYPIKNIEHSYNKFIRSLGLPVFEQEIERQSYELFPDEEPNDNQIQYIKTKIILEWVSSFMKIAKDSWENLHEILKILATYPETKSIYDKITNIHLSKIEALHKDGQQFLNRIKHHYNGHIVGASKKDNETLVSNLIYDEDFHYDYTSLFTSAEKENKAKVSTESIIDQLKADIMNKKEEKPAPIASSKPHQIYQDDEYYFTELIGTKEWNRKDCYILFVKNSVLKEEEKKFYSSSFVTLKPNEALNINLAAALVRQNNGYSFALKYNKMIQTLLEYAVDSLFSKDFVGICDDIRSFLYHIGPIVLNNIIQEDLLRRDFGHCYYVEKNSVIKFFPENIIKKHIIDYWAETFHGLKSSSVDSYINYSKGIQGVKDSYKHYFDKAAATRKRGHGDNKSIEEFLLDNSGRFFGYRRTQVFRRFIADSIFETMPEVNSVEMVRKFSV
ncbi:MAG: hypothetical protein AAF518_06205 [Spirochaetota bacterium]